MLREKPCVVLREKPIETGTCVHFNVVYTKAETLNAQVTDNAICWLSYSIYSANVSQMRHFLGEWTLFQSQQHSAFSPQANEDFHHLDQTDYVFTDTYALL